MQIISIFYELTTAQDNVADHIKARILIKFNVSNNQNNLMHVQGSLSEKDKIKFIVPKVHFFNKLAPVVIFDSNTQNYIDELVAKGWNLLNKTYNELECTKRYEFKDNRIHVRNKE